MFYPDQNQHDITFPIKIEFSYNKKNLPVSFVANWCYEEESLEDAITYAFQRKFHQWVQTMNDECKELAKAFDISDLAEFKDQLEIFTHLISTFKYKGLEYPDFI